MTKLSRTVTIARVVLGTIFVVFGLNGFLGFLPQADLPPEAGAFIGALAATGYMFPLVKGIEVLTGLLLLGNRFVPLALILLAPIVVNIFAFHTVLDPNLMAFVVLGLQLFLAWSYRAHYRRLFVARAEPIDAA